MNRLSPAHIRTMEAHSRAHKALLDASLVGSLGIVFLPVADADIPAEDSGACFTVRATMPADARTCQPFGFLSGGASLALAETLAGWGSMLTLQPGERPVGASVSANHVCSLEKGRQALATASLLHHGRTTHVWNVDITDAETGRLISTARVLNHILSPREQVQPVPRQDS